MNTFVIFLKILVTIAFTVFALTQCTEKKPKPKIVLELEKSYKVAQEDLSKFDAKIKAATGEEGLIIQLNYEKELAKSRLERLKTQLKQLSPESVIEATAGGGHGGGH